MTGFLSLILVVSLNHFFWSAEVVEGEGRNMDGVGVNMYFLHIVAFADIFLQFILQLMLVVSSSHQQQNMLSVVLIFSNSSKIT